MIFVKVYQGISHIISLSSLRYSNGLHNFDIYNGCWLSNISTLKIKATKLKELEWHEKNIYYKRYFLEGDQ